MGPVKITNTKQIVQDTWDELGYKIRPVGRRIWVRAFPPAPKSKLLVLPDKYNTMFGELPHQVTTRAVVISTPPNSKVKIGDKICFTRLYFTWHVGLEDKSYVGHIKENDITGYFQD